LRPTAAIRHWSGISGKSDGKKTSAGEKQRCQEGKEQFLTFLFDTCRPVALWLKNKHHYHVIRKRMMTGVFMKHLLVVAAALILALPVAAPGADKAAPAAPLPPGHPSIAVPRENPPITGKVLETMESGGYTYVYLKQKKGKKIWVAFPTAKVSVGKTVSLVSGSEFKNFKSKTLNRTFDRIIFSLGPVQKKGTKEIPQQTAMPGSKEAMVAPVNIRIDKASGANAYTVAELFAQKGKLNGKKVVVKGKVVKVSPRIMKRNWVHLQDGTGSAGKKNHDLVVTMTALPADGQTITVSGTLLKDKEFGMGYKYEVLIDSAEIVK